MFTRHLTPIVIAAQMIIWVADEIPYFDVASTCRAETANIQASLQFCIQDEQRAHNRLIQKWAQFATVDKAVCSRTAESNGSSGYVKLLSCLELAKNAMKPPGN